MSDFIQELKNDHRVIQQVVAGMSAVAELLDSGKQVDPSVLADLVQFLRVFADHCHHEREEQYLFPLLATKANRSASARGSSTVTPSQIVIAGSVPTSGSAEASSENTPVRLKAFPLG